MRKLWADWRLLLCMFLGVLLLAVGIAIWLWPTQRMLQAAARAGDAQRVRWALDWGIDPNRRDSHGFNLAGVPSTDNPTLILAVRSGSTETVALLLDRGANIDATGGDMKTPISLAVEKNDLLMVKFLKDRGAKVDFDGSYSTPLHLAIRAHFDSVSEYLLSEGMSIDATDRMNYTPLCRAVELGDTRALQFALSHGADPNVCCMRQIGPKASLQTPLEWVRSRIVSESASMQKLLQNWSAESQVAQPKQKKLDDLRAIERILSSAVEKPR